MSPAHARRRIALLALVCAVVGTPLAAAQRAADARSFVCTDDGVWIGAGISYGPHRDGQRPGEAGPTRQQIAEDLDTLRRHWRLLRMYGADEAAQTALEVIRVKDLGMKVMVGAWIDPEHGRNAGKRAANRRQIAKAIELANAYPDIVAAINVGNETQVSWSSHRVAPEVLIGYIREARSQTAVPITTADDFTFWLEPRSKSIAAEVDFICTHIYAMWRGEQLEDAIAFTQRQFEAVRKAHPDHQIVISEAGWATKKHTEGDQAKYIAGRPGEVEQKQFYDAFEAWTTRERIPTFYFEAFDENWKGGAHPNEVEKHWGLYNSDRTPKLALRAKQNRVTATWRERVCALSWICYNPSDSDPSRGDFANLDSVRADLEALHDAGFTGLITYACQHPTMRRVVAMAEAAGFSGVIVGLWDPLDEEEHAAACALAKRKVVLGLCAGNEGLGKRYEFAPLTRAIDALRTATGKPVTTTEEVEDYLDDRLLNLGDWIFPNAHPIYTSRTEVAPAVRWTTGALRELRRRSGRFVWIKEIGWPSAGGAAFTDAQQAAFFTQLAENGVTFAYFEAFDQPWKTWQAGEPHFGLFDEEREPKALAATFLTTGAPPLSCGKGLTQNRKQTPDAVEYKQPFYVYRDAGDPQNHFTPTGREGDAGDVLVDEAWTENVHHGKTCVRVKLAADGAAPNRCDYGPPCRWAGLRWLHPALNWGRDAKFADQGLDLRGYQRVVFWARADAACNVTFLVGGVDTEYGDSISYPVRDVFRIGDEWRRYSIDLGGCDLRRIIAGFGCASSWESNPEGITLYLDDIYFE